MGTKIINLTFSCEHRVRIEGVDDSVRVWKEYYKLQPCYTCKPTQTIERLCGHVEEAARGFFSPRAAEASAMQLCTACNESR